jgi:hypothetical protein
MNRIALGIFFVLFWTVAFVGAGCMPFHSRGPGMEIDIHSQAYHDQHYGRHDKYDHWDQDGRWDDNGHWDNRGNWHGGNNR